MTDRGTDRRTGDSKERAIAYMLSRAKNVVKTIRKTTHRVILKYHKCMQAATAMCISNYNHGSMVAA